MSDSGKQQWTGLSGIPTISRRAASSLGQWAGGVIFLNEKFYFTTSARQSESIHIVTRKIVIEPDWLLQQCASWDGDCSYATFYASTTECPQLRGPSGAEDVEVSTYHCSRPRSAPLAACETTCGVQAGVIRVQGPPSVSYTHLTLPTIYSV